MSTWTKTVTNGEMKNNLKVGEIIKNRRGNQRDLDMKEVTEIRG